MVSPIDEMEATLTAIAHGGECVARLPGERSGRVVFVRGGIPGERVRIRLTNTSRDSWWRGVVTSVLEASPDRVAPPCPVAGICGGCDWQHIALYRQRALKAQVVREQLKRLGRVHCGKLITEEVPGDVSGLAWRTRMRYLAHGKRIGLRAWSSHDMVPTPPGGCPLVAPGGPDDDTVAHLNAGRADNQVGVTIAASGWTVWRMDGGTLAGQELVTQQAIGRDFQVRADGFWQVHPGAGDALAGAVCQMLQPQPGERALDLYCGAGLFSAMLADAGVQVFGIEADQAAVVLARSNVPEATFTRGFVERAEIRASSIVVLDPPRAGAGANVIRRIVNTRPRAIAYVACDPASLARDTALLQASGYRLGTIRAFDIFPMTAHVETVALFEV